MTTFISRNYIITALMVAKDKLQINESYITLTELDSFIRYLNEEFYKKEVDVIIINDDINNDYFHFESNHMCIALNEPNNFGLEKVKRWYLGYLPFEVLEILYGDIALKIAFHIVISAKEAKVANLIKEINTLKINNENLFEDSQELKLIPKK